MSNILKQVADNLYAGNNTAVSDLTRKALDEGLTAGEVLIAARAMHAGMDILKPLLAEGEVESAGKVVVGTVAGDMHDIGKNLVIMMMEGGGFEVIDAGIDVAPEKFAEIVKAEQPDLLGLSALLTTTMPAMKGTINTLEKAGVRDSVKVIVGGAPVTQAHADESMVELEEVFHLD